MSDATAVARTTTTTTVRERRDGSPLAPWLLLLPGLLVLVPFYVVPMLSTFLLSFYGVRDFAVVTELTVENYTRIFGDWFYLRSLLTTMRISLIVCAFTLVLGYPLAWEIARARGRYRAALTLIVLAPLLVGLIVRSYGWLIVLGPRGLINNTFLAMGIIDRPFPLLWTEAAIYIGLAHVFLPFMVLGVLGSLQSLDWNLVLAARSLGATRTAAWRRVVLPLSLPGVGAGTMLVFALSMSAFVTPVMLGGKAARVLAVYAWQQNTVVLDYPFGAALAVVLLLAGGLAVGLYMRLLRSGRPGMTVS
ncbi:MAG: ABC transporter permease [Candidatus Rokubacteria bacterium]|nr:ABC transporter permease [Candidatus Rokubacteria bacterium]